ncbi:MAG TPA: aldehyde dehydrogenase family protein [Vicinamibacteria bacterium]|nr:aldehyde dehydrogenase family protein [Vicinamibacteria bacterium]
MATAAQPSSGERPVFHSWVANREVPGEAGARDVLSPSTARPFAQASLLSAEQASSAISAALQAFPAWSALSLRERGRHLLALRERLLLKSEEIADLVAEEQGKPVAEAHLVEIFPSLECLKHLGEHAEDLLGEDPVDAEVLLFAHKDCRLLYAPYGVVLVITPWNYPLSISLTGVAAALVAGNTVVLKPAPATTLIGLKLGELCRDAGLPPGVVNVLALDDVLAPTLVEDPRLGKIVFTGSVATGKKVMAGAAKHLTPVVLELGGKDAAIVCRDARLEQAARGIVWGAFLNAGQTCASVERVYVEAPVAEAFVAQVVAETRTLRQGDPRAAEVDLGPMTLERQRTLVEEHVADAVAKGARVLTGGARGDGPGYFYPPTVLVDVDHSMRIMREETFGPVLPIMKVESLDEAIRLANDSDYGLTASGWTRSADTARRLQRELSAGVVTINDCVASFAEPTAPWGGFKQSGVGRTHGMAGLREMVQVKYVSRDTSRRPLVWWFPYGDAFRRLMVIQARAFHARSLLRRLLAQAAILRFGRFWKRANLPGVLLNLDKLF